MEARHCTPNFQFLELCFDSHKETKEELWLVLRQEYTNYMAVYGRSQEDCVPSDNQIEAQAMAPISQYLHLHSPADLEQTQTMEIWESATV